MIVAIASGKGGTGKTTLAVHLAARLAKSSDTALVDLDVEAPDSDAYFPEAKRTRSRVSVSIKVAEAVDGAVMTTKACASICRFGAIVAIKGILRINAGLCKACGRCLRACPEGSIRERLVTIGQLDEKRWKRLALLRGVLAVGDIRATAVIDGAKKRAAAMPVAYQIRDCPPGATCPTVRAVHGANICLLVAEPTEFSVHDLSAALRMLAGMGMASAIVINKAGTGTADFQSLAQRYHAPVIAEIPWTEGLAKAGAAGRRADDDADLARAMDKIAHYLGVPA
jgi:MinD superfamily P-loop ATPase